MVDLRFELCLVVFDLLPGELLELCVDVEADLDEILLHILPVFQFVVEVLAPVEDGAQLVVRWHLGLVNWPLGVIIQR